MIWHLRNALREHNVLYDPMKVFMCLLLKKADKPSYEVKKAWRGILISTEFRKIIPTMELRRVQGFLRHMNALGHTVVSGRKGFPAAVFAIKKIRLAIEMSDELKINLIIATLDMDSCYPNLTKRLCAWLLTWFGLPQDVVARFLQYNENNVGVMMEFKAIAESSQSPVAADFDNLWDYVHKHTVHFDSLGTVQGCNSCRLVNAIVNLVMGTERQRI